ncbi:MAG: complex I subunit 5 family protein [Lachnospiraceae bacterium]|nr:complex I subunit 5 family protein [Lachnospiraceae bacterium]
MDTYRIGRIAGFGLNFAFDGFRIVYSFVTVLMWFCSTLISREYFGKGENLMRYGVLSMWTFAATIGVFLSNDLYTTFIFFEIMSIASYAFVAHTEKPDAMKAAGTYLAVAVIGGLVMLMGLLLLNDSLQTMNLREISEAAERVLNSGNTSEIHKLYAAGGLILFGFGAKAGSFPLHIWLPKAHPVAPAPASALLSGVLTKSGVFGILVLCIEVFHDTDGFGLLICILGMITMVVGALLAVFSVDLKRTLACSSVSQIGFIMTGVGLVPLLKEECTLALSGAMLYMVNHSLFKLTLFLCAAVVYMKLHKLNLNDIRGFGKDKPVLRVLFLIGALGISGVPLLSGYVAKTLIHEGIVEYIHVASGGLKTYFKILEWVYLISGGMTFAYMTKLYFCLFVDDQGINVEKLICDWEAAHDSLKDKTDESVAEGLKNKNDVSIAKEKISYQTNTKIKAVTGNLNDHMHSGDVGRISYAAIIPPAVLIVLFGLGAKLYISKFAAFMGNFNTFAYDYEQLGILKEIKIFSLENLKGSLISISFGIIFFLLIRKFLCIKNSDGSVSYRNLWPNWLDLEELVYRPVLLTFFPWLFRTLGVFICDTLPKLVFYGVLWIFKKIAYFIACSIDSAVSFLENTVFKPLTVKKHPKLDKIKAYLVGGERTGKIITATLSYGMMMICVGLIITLLYLLYLLFS